MTRTGIPNTERELKSPGGTEAFRAGHDKAGPAGRRPVGGGTPSKPTPALSLRLVPQAQETEPALPEPGAILALIDHGPDHWRSPADPARIVVGLSPLGPALREIWRAPAPVRTGWEDGIGFVAGPEVLFAHLLLPDDGVGDLAALTCSAYSRLLDLIRSQGFPHPLRIWNLLFRIHDCPGGLERYRAFCVGRERALHRAGVEPAAFPAASAVGSAAPGLLVYLFAGRSAGTPVENPRQLSAWRYPRQYGPRPPSFARALRAPWGGAAGPFFISGTAAVVGHRSQHPGAARPQVAETLRNLNALLAQGAAGAPDFLKVYLRNPQELASVQEALRGWLPANTPLQWLQAEVCRAELAIEIEGVCGMAADGPK